MQYGGAWHSRLQAVTAHPITSADDRRFDRSSNSLLDEAPSLHDPKRVQEDAQAKPRQRATKALCDQCPEAGAESESERRMV